MDALGNVSTWSALNVRAPFSSDKRYKDINKPENDGFEKSLYTPNLATSNVLH